MAVNLKVVLPVWFQDIIEFRELLKTEEAQLEQSEEEIRKVRDNCYIQTADEDAIRRMERLCGIQYTGGDLEERRDSILLWLNLKVPYTELGLRQLLAGMLGENGFLLTVNKNRYEMDLKIVNQGLPALHNIWRMVFKMVPAHIILTFWGNQQMNYKVPIEYENMIKFRTAFYPRYNFPFLYLDNIWRIDRKRMLSGYNADSLVDFYPVYLRFKVPMENHVESAQQLKFITGAQEKITECPKFLCQTEARASPETEEQFNIKTTMKEQPDAGQVRVMNLNVLDNQWKLGRSRKLNGGLSILL